MLMINNAKTFNEPGSKIYKVIKLTKCCNTRTTVASILYEQLNFVALDIKST